ncbi:recombination protein NinG [uncultured Paraglaciecola sp.]|uniref:recombination protein NinG n=1 Tax=uncultured Paraglaciecola sp. TaxID=1765024 RepID=UPI00260CC700|nr:recombination protein NinG [uncultured Paraglaciecola sp.]
MTAQPKPRRRKCKVKDCGQWFQPFNSFQSWCSDACGYQLSLEKLAKKKAKEQREERASLNKAKAERIRMKRDFRAKDKPHQTKLTQQVFNRWVRLSDTSGECISCGITYGQAHAGHYRSIGSAPELRFEPLNCHLQCQQCNTSKSGNIKGYREGLIKRIGIEKVEWLEGPHEAKHYTCDDLIEIRAHYQRLIRSSCK